MKFVYFLLAFVNCEESTGSDTSVKASAKEMEAAKEVMSSVKQEEVGNDADKSSSSGGASKSTSGSTSEPSKSSEAGVYSAKSAMLFIAAVAAAQL